MARLSPYIISIWFLLLTPAALPAQVSFGIYSDYDITVGMPMDLDFGDLVPNEGVRQINLGDPGMVVIPITGVEYLDILVTIIPDANLILDGMNQIPLTITAAYANKGSDNITQAVIIDGNQTVFPIRQRENRPPGPPPTPPHEGYTPPEATAYLYIYGSINVGNISGGQYLGNVDIIIEYD